MKALFFTPFHCFSVQSATFAVNVVLLLRHHLLIEQYYSIDEQYL